MVLEVKSSQNCPINAGVPQIPIFCLTVFMRYIFQGLSGNVICNMGTYADDTTFCLSVIRLLICDICSSWLLNLNLICETVRSGLGNGLIWGRLSLTLGKLILGNTTELI